MTTTDIQYLNTMSTMEKNASEIGVNKLKGQLLEAQTDIARKESRAKDLEFGKGILDILFKPAEAGAKLLSTAFKLAGA